MITRDTVGDPETAVPVSEDIRNEIKILMKGQATGEIEMQEIVVPDLIGGFILQWKDKQYNASIEKQLKRLQTGVTRVNLYKKDFNNRFSEHNLK